MAVVSGLVPHLVEFYDEYGRDAPELQNDVQPAVDVTLEPFGWLGTFRPSAKTNRWHASDSVTHEWGNA